MNRALPTQTHSLRRSLKDRRIFRTNKGMIATSFARNVQKSIAHSSSFWMNELSRTAKIKRLLRHKKTGKWISHNGTAIQHAGNARNFETLQELVQFSADRRLKDMEVVLRFEEDGSDAAFPLADT